MKPFCITIIVILSLSVFMYLKNQKDPVSLGLDESGNLKELKNSPNGVSTLTEDTSKRVEPLPFFDDFETTKKKILKSIDLLGNYEIITDNDNYLHIIFISNFFKFKDDVEIYFDKKEKLVHYRSQSRVGYSDFGVNKERYTKIKNNYLDVSN